MQTKSPKSSNGRMKKSESLEFCNGVADVFVSR